MDQLVSFVIRPPRAEYSPPHDLLEQEFTLKGRRYKRKDLRIPNSQGCMLECSHYMPCLMPEDTALPCVIYCHGNSGCRADANEAAIILLPSNITVFTLDFSGSGLSEGEYVTLGWNEMEDLKAVVSHLRLDKRVSCIGLWGRSMGAVTSIMYAAQDPSVAGIVVDSPFSNLVDLMMELVDVYKVRLPKFTLKVAIQYMRKVIQKKAQFDIMDLDTIQFAGKSFIPALFGHATEDAFIQAKHSDLIYKAYAGDKNIIKFEGDHNSPRPQFYYDSITIFFFNVLQPPEAPIADLEQGGVDYDPDDLDFDSAIDENVLYEILNGIQQTQQPPSDSVAFPNLEEFNENSIEEAINQSRSRWQMSRTEMPVDLGEPQDDMSDVLRRGDLREYSEASSSILQGERDGESVESTSRAISNANDIERWNGYLRDGISNAATTCLQESFADFPSTVDDEERMLMEAISASLQDVRISDIVPQQISEPEQTSRREVSMDQEASSAPSGEALPPETSTHIVSTREPEIRQMESQPQSTEAPTLGLFEALGQRWGIGLFRAIGSRRST